jgi:prepilin-type N-terminal cleavage/methylation domain-containing protein
MCYRNEKIRGFTLVELSIVIIIIGFLIAGISAGTSLIQQAKLNALIREFGTYGSAVLEFQSIYGYLPGDLPNATSYWPNGNTANGDGDGTIGYASNSNSPFEDTYAWNQLSLAGLIKGSYIGGLQGVRYTAGVNVPISAYGSNTGYELSENSTFNNPVSNTMLEVGAYRASGGLYDNAAIMPVDAYAIDNKMDDGNPQYGIIQTMRGESIDSSNVCVNHAGFGSVPTSPVTYLLTDDTASCRIFYIINRNE